MSDSYLCAICYEYWHGWPRLFNEEGREFCSKACLKVYKRRERNCPGVEFVLPDPGEDFWRELDAGLALTPPVPKSDNAENNAPAIDKEHRDA